MDKFLKIFRPIARIVLPRMVVVGIDVQDRHISLVSLKQGPAKKEFQILKSLQEIPDEAIKEGSIVSPDLFFDATKLLLGSLELPRLRTEPVIVLSLPPHHIYAETILFPLMPEAELQQAIDLKLETSLPWPKKDAYYDWRRLKIDDPRRVGVFLSAISKEVLDAYLKVFLQGEWRVATCEFHLLSLSRLIENQPVDYAFILILIDEDGAEFAIMHKGQMFAHLLKKAGKDTFSQTVPFEVRRLAAYAESELKLTVKQIFVFDKAGLENQLSSLEEKTGLPTKPLFASISPDADPRLFIAAGAAKRQFGSDDEGINLVPPGSGGRFNENLLIRTINLWANILGVFFSISIFSCAAVLFFLRTQTKVLSHENVLLSQTVDSQIVQSQVLIKQAATFNELATELANARTSETKYGQQISAILNEAEKQSITITNIQASAPTNPFAVTLVSPTREKILAFKTGLEQGGTFKSVTIPVSQLIGETNLTINAVIQ